MEIDSISPPNGPLQLNCCPKYWFVCCVERGKERLRFTPTPLHSDKDMDLLILAMKDVWTKLNLTKKIE